MWSEHGKRVLEFEHLCRSEIPTAPTMPSEKVRRLRARLILEEAFETVEALGFRPVKHPAAEKSLTALDFLSEWTESCEPDLEEIADGCADVRVVCTGTLVRCGIEDKELQEAVDQANLNKFKGEYSYSDTGKLIKPSDWRPPDIAGILEAQRNKT